MANKEKLSERQHKMLEYIQNYTQEHGRPPTIREIGQAVNISSTSVVNYNLTKLAEKELIDRESEVSRGLRLTEKARTMMGFLMEEVSRTFVPVPLVNYIGASTPLNFGNDGFATFDVDPIQVSVSLLPERVKPEELYALKVRGDSMIDAMVSNNDIVIMRKQSEARNGDMVAVWIDNDTMTLKYFYKEGTRVRLQPANPTMDPIYIDDPVRMQIQGRVMMVIRPIA